VRWTPGEGLPEPGSSADRLLDSAERLVALEGLHGVSSRAITLAAGHRNSNAIAYHFGDRRGLLTAVWYRRTVAIDRRRTREVGALERDGGTRDAEALVAVLLRPIAAELALRTPTYWARFNESLASGYPLDAVDRLAAQSAAQSAADPGTAMDGLVRTLTHLRALSAGGREPLANRRVAQLLRLGITTFACWERDCDAGLLERSVLGAVCEDLVRTGAALVTAGVDRDAGPAPGASPDVSLHV